MGEKRGRFEGKEEERRRWEQRRGQTLHTPSPLSFPKQVERVKDKERGDEMRWEKNGMMENNKESNGTKEERKGEAMRKG